MTAETFAALFLWACGGVPDDLKNWPDESSMLRVKSTLADFYRNKEHVLSLAAIEFYDEIEAGTIRFEIESDSGRVRFPGDDEEFARVRQVIRAALEARLLETLDADPDAFRGLLGPQP